MKLEVIGKNGLHPREVRAVTMMVANLRDKWQAYASLVITDEQGGMEIDMLIVTHDRVLLVEIKDWNGKLESHQGEWIINGRSRGRSPYSIKKAHALRIQNLLSRELGRTLGYFPLVEAHVVLSGSATPENLPPGEARFVHRLEDFLLIREQHHYDQFCAQHAKSHDEFFKRSGFDRPNTEGPIALLNAFFCNSKSYVSPMKLKVNNFEAGEYPLRVHNGHLFNEYVGSDPDLRSSKALLRCWDFSKLKGYEYLNEAWIRILQREEYIYREASSSESRLEGFMLKPATTLDVENVQSDHAESFLLKQSYERLDKYLKSEGSKLTVEKRINLVKALLVPFTELHGLGLAHRDINAENLWHAATTDSIITTGYYSAYKPDKATIRDIRIALASSSYQLPEDALGDEGEIRDPFRIDVFQLGMVAHRICFNDKRICRDEEIPLWEVIGEDDPFEGKLNSFFARALDWLPANRFESAAEMHATFNQLTMGETQGFDDTEEVHSALINSDFIKPKLSIMSFFRRFPAIGEEEDDGEIIRYRYEAREGIGFLKFWQNIQIDIKNPSLNRRINRFRQRIERAVSRNLPISQVLDYGILSGGGLYVATSFVPGESWTAMVDGIDSVEARLILAKRLCETIEYMHHHEFYHGDLHPENIIFRDAEIDGVGELDRNLILIDVLDFGTESDPYNTSYGPTNPTVTDDFGRDRFAVYTIIRELFPEDCPKALAEELERANNQRDHVPVSLAPLRESLNLCLTPEPEQEPEAAIAEECALVLSWPYGDVPSQPVIVAKEDMGYQVSCKPDSRNPDLLWFRVIGLDTELSITIDPIKKQITGFRFIPNMSLSQVLMSRKGKTARLLETIKVVRGMADRDVDDRLVIILLDMGLHKKAQEIEDEAESLSAEKSAVGVTKPSEIWNVLLQKESELSLRVEIAEGEIIENNSGNLVIPYVQTSKSWVDYFERSDKVYVSLEDADNSFGTLVLSDLRSDTMVVSIARSSIKSSLKPGKKIVIESQRTKSSRDRRAKALERVLEGGSLISRLPDYFDMNSKLTSRVMADVPDEAKIRETYDNLGGSKQYLNERQIDAFKRVISEGPIGVLQGPPGTGKTAFISKLIHYLYSNGLAKNILLVGQSNATVDNVAIKARELCEQLGTEISVVRVGNESAVDPKLVQDHPSSIQRQIQNRFHREYDQRINALASRLMLSQELVSTLSSLNRVLYPLMANLRSLRAQLKKIDKFGLTQPSTAEERERIQSQMASCIERMHRTVESRDLGIEVPDANENDFWENLTLRLAHVYEETDRAGLRRLSNLFDLSQEWIDVLSSGEANYDRFLVKTSSLVCGTLVGMGSKFLAINESQFDWVIVDEAARAQASELMIPLQSAKRCLLVGDHRQLPPLYEDGQVPAVAKQLNISPKEVAKTDFERAFEVNNGITLDTQYRMIEPISEIISRCFYADDIDSDGLKTGRSGSPDWYGELPYPLNRAVAWIDSGQAHNGGGDGESGGSRKGYTNAHECELIKTLLMKLCTPEVIENLKAQKSEEHPHPIGIITMYQQQKVLLKGELSKAEWAGDIRDLIKIDTVDSYQGQENRLIFLSLVRDNDKAKEGFLGHTARINVALSRAQERLVIVGSRNMWNIGNVNSTLGKVLNFIETKVSLEAPDYILVDGKRLIEGEHND